MIRTNVDLAPRTTFKLGGPARSYATVHSVQALQSTLRESASERIFLLGSGSNLLIHDDGVPGLVIANRINTVSFKERGGSVLVTAGAGMEWDDLVSACIAKDLRGIECLSGIPGRLGAAPVQNIGAYGQTIADVLYSVQAIDRDYGEMHELTAKECGFGYRESIFQTRPLIITSISLLLKLHGEPALKYQDLQMRFHGSSPSLNDVRQAVLEIRGAKGALMMDEYPRLRSAGSFFKNPAIPADVFALLKERMQHADSGRSWFWEQNDGTVKIAAARLIEGAGFKKGFRDGPVGISPHHALSLIAYHGASSADVVRLARRIQESVRGRFSIHLDVEPQLWGWDTYPLLRSTN